MSWTAIYIAGFWAVFVGVIFACIRFTPRRCHWSHDVLKILAGLLAALTWPWLLLLLVVFVARGMRKAGA